MIKKSVRIATRKSKLALWQAEHVASLLRNAHPGITVELLPMTTQGDRELSSPLANIGGKGLFIKELEYAILEGRADIAVHSMKDVPANLPGEMCIGAVLEREDPRDAFISVNHANLDELPPGATIGSSSLRRECQIRRYRDDIQIQNLRGNVDTRLAKLQEKKYDAIILAAAGLKRLDLAEWITSYLSPEVSLPAIAQGTIGIECRSDDSEIRAIISAINHGPTWIVTQTERALNKRLQGDCNTPMAGFAQLGENQITLRALIGSTDGQTILTANKQGSLDSPVELGYTVAEDMLKQGAAALLKTDTS